MAITSKQAHYEVERLVEKFESLTVRQLDRYTEANTCKDFITPMFGAARSGGGACGGVATVA